MDTNQPFLAPKPSISQIRSLIFPPEIHTALARWISRPARVDCHNISHVSSYGLTMSLFYAHIIYIYIYISISISIYIYNVHEIFPFMEYLLHKSRTIPKKSNFPMIFHALSHGFFEKSHGFSTPAPFSKGSQRLLQFFRCDPILLIFQAQLLFNPRWLHWFLWL